MRGSSSVPELDELADAFHAEEVGSAPYVPAAGGSKRGSAAQHHAAALHSALDETYAPEDFMRVSRSFGRGGGSSAALGTSAVSPDRVTCGLCL